MYRYINYNFKKKISEYIELNKNNSYFLAKYSPFNVTAVVQYLNTEIEISTPSIFAPIIVDSFHCIFDNSSPSWSNRRTNHSSETCTI